MGLTRKVWLVRYLAVECSDVVDQCLAAKLCVITEEHHYPTMASHLTLVQQATVQDAVVIVLNRNVIQFSLDLQNHTHQVMCYHPLPILTSCIVWPLTRGWPAEKHVCRNEIASRALVLTLEDKVLRASNSCMTIQGIISTGRPTPLMAKSLSSARKERCDTSTLVSNTRYSFSCTQGGSEGIHS